ncbi:M28 family metallopeptidase [Gordonia sinesedis]
MPPMNQEPVRMLRKLRRPATALACAALVALSTTVAGTGTAAADPVAEGFGDLLARNVNTAGVTAHLRALQSIADRNGGNRALGSPGYRQSLDYVEAQLRQAGFLPRRQDLTATVFDVKDHKLSAGGQTIESEVLGYSGATPPLTAPVSQVPSSDTTPGCQAADFGPATRGSIAVVDRGVCTFADKATNAKRAGARAVVFVNNEDGPLAATLGEDVEQPLPAVAVARQLGAQVRQARSLTVAVDATVTRAKTWNLIAETYLGLPNSVTMVGAHLDGVPEGPGINDNGSGTAGVLQAAKTMTAFAPVKNKVRFAFWAAEEQGLVGSTRYVETLPKPERAKIKRYINFDMIGSHNGGYFVYDGDGSSKLEGAYPGPAGSGEIEQVLTRYLTARGVKPEVSGFDGRSDYDPFASAGIASGGADSGADKVKTPAQAAKWGGQAGLTFDPNYHTDRDTYANVNRTILGNLAPAVAYAAGYFAMH